MALADLLDIKVQGALVRSQFHNIPEVDAPSSFFFSLEKKSRQKKVIHTLLSDAWQELMEPSQIRRRADEFYSSLYSSECEEEDTLQEEFCSKLPQVSTETNSQLESHCKACRDGELPALMMDFYIVPLVTLSKFFIASAARVNWKKSEALALGEWCDGLPVLPREWPGKQMASNIWECFWKKTPWSRGTGRASQKRLREKFKMEMAAPSNVQDPVPAAAGGCSGAGAEQCLALGSLLGLYSVQVAKKTSGHRGSWERRTAFYSQGETTLDPTDPFPEIYLSPGLGDMTGPLLTITSSNKMTLHRADKKLQLCQ
ncbi:hypothetical protein L3Q82_020017, partial [Scortum barcoo]